MEFRPRRYDISRYMGPGSGRTWGFTGLSPLPSRENPFTFMAMASRPEISLTCATLRWRQPPRATMAFRAGHTTSVVAPGSRSIRYSTSLAALPAGLWMCGARPRRRGTCATRLRTRRWPGPILALLPPCRSKKELKRSLDGFRLHPCSDEASTFDRLDRDPARDIWLCLGTQEAAGWNAGARQVSVGSRRRRTEQETLADVTRILQTIEG